MLKILGNGRQSCGGWSRRGVLEAGGMGLLGLSLPKLLAAEDAQQPQRPAKAKSVIFLFLFGGPSQLETFDMKPEAPEKIRGPFKPIACRTPDLKICEHLPRLASISDKFAVVRTMSHSYNDHSGGGHYIQTGHPWHVPIGGGFNATEKDWPAIGSVVEYFDEQSRRAREMPSFVYLPNRLGHLQTYSTRLDRPGQYAGWLGRGYDPLASAIQKRDPKDNPYFRACTDDELDFRIKGLAEQDGITLDRLAGRQSLLGQFDQGRAALDASGAAASYDRFQQRALSLVSSVKIREAIDIRREPAQVRDRYGRHLFGQSTLLARRLIEAGTRFVTVAWDAPDGYSWDSHTTSNDVKNHLLPGLDSALAALLEDLDERGLLDETLVVCLGEMGRTPQANPSWGRSHWSFLFPAVLAGAGVRGGIAHGHSDKDAAYAMAPPTRPEDLAATIFSALGIDPQSRLHNPSGRPVFLVEGRVMNELFG